MERDDLDVLVIGHAGSDEVDAVLYDPMPGGSGLLDQFVARWEDVLAAARETTEHCPGACGRSCIDCLQTFRNQFAHKMLDRFEVVRALDAWGTQLVPGHVIPSRMPSPSPTGDDAPANQAESRLRELLGRAGFPEPVLAAHHRPRATAGDDAPGLLLRRCRGPRWRSLRVPRRAERRLHGNDAAQVADRRRRQALEVRGYSVIEIPASDLPDRVAMQAHFVRLARALLGPADARRLRETTAWFDEPVATPAPTATVLPFRRVTPARDAQYRTCVPVVSLRAAASRFGAPDPVEVIAWVELPPMYSPRDGMFVAQVTGRSMEPRIPDGAWCLFGPATAPLDEKVTLVQHRSVADPDTGGSYTVKKLEFTRETRPDEEPSVAGIRLVPLNTMYRTWDLALERAEELRVVAELVDVLDAGGGP